MKATATDVEEADMNREVGTIVVVVEVEVEEDIVEREEDMTIHTDTVIEIGKDGMNILLGLHWVSITEINDHNTPLLVNRETDRYPPNDRPCLTLEIVLPPLSRYPETPAHPAPSPKRCNSRQGQNPQRITLYLNQF